MEINKSPKILHRWLREIFPKEEMATKSCDSIIRKLMPYKTLYNCSLDYILMPVLNDQTCTSYDKFKNLVNIRIKYIKQLQRK